MDPLPLLTLNVLRVASGRVSLNRPDQVIPGDEWPGLAQRGCVQVAWQVVVELAA